MAKDKIINSKNKDKKNNANNTEKLLKNENSKSSIWQDERFQHLVADPRFKNLPKTQRKVKIDKRFQGMFTDAKFQVKYKVDKYGRKVDKSNADDLKKYYELDKSSEDELEEQRKEEKAILGVADSSKESDSEEEETSEPKYDLKSDDEQVSETIKERLLDPNIDYARGEGRLLTDSSSDEESSSDEDSEVFIDHVWGELDADADTTQESTRRLAVCNMDWDRIQAQDLMVLFNSFLPLGGCILSIKIYPSEFGKERMAQEDKYGPIELKKHGKPNKPKNDEMNLGDENDAEEEEEDLVQEQDSDAEEGDEYHMEKLRQYQLNRLRYFYAVVECDSVATADKIYKECDGIEYESSATKVDLRFIPDDTSFDEDEPTDVCTEMPDTNAYKPRQFTTTALQQAKVDLTWDETAVERKELGDKLASGKLDEVDDKELRKIVAYSSEEDDEEVNVQSEDEKSQLIEHTSVSNQKIQKKKPKKKSDMINKYKALLAEITEKEQKEKEKKYEMELTWNIEEKPKDQYDDTVTSQQESSKLTPIEKILQKKAEKNKKRKEERKKKMKQALGETSNDSEDSDSIPDGVDMNDPYFAEEFANGDFIEPKVAKNKTKKQKQNKNEIEKEEKQREDELALLLDDNEDDGKQHFSLEKIIKAEQETKSKKKRRKQLKKSKSTIAEQRKELDDNFEINLNDDRFKAIYTSPNFNIDPTDSHFKKTKGMEQLIHEKLKRRHGNDDGINKNNMEALEKRPKKQIEHNLLIKSLKRKLKTN